MKLLSILLFFTFGIGYDNSVKNTTTKQSTLNGTWIPVKQQFGGNELPKEAFEKQRLVLNDSTYIVTAESVDKGVVKLSDNKMDIYGRDGVNKGKHFTAIYKLENGQLTVCYNLAGTSYPESFDTKDKPMFFLAVYQKEPSK
ncbi:TIGR03067 domain-containing protein [Mucilaginibacter arboris]|uniref:TIGR03067 domain-containing protein n=1 Tax=Mucilaginibacter arboris TaxID=2682090 RepID=A0A7K1SX72_9SPHI|nr:TIGR03067 domain-containing protein [Mucilaginibacter arboris]MVN21935.1 TIGR03067 domain-containing protein [Mucilaginibacter arboris]